MQTATTVLIVEDKPDQAMRLERALANCKHAVYTIYIAHSCNEALQIAKVQDISVVLMDMNLGKHPETGVEYANGIEASAALFKILPNIVLIGVSAFPETYFERAEDAIAPHNWLTKPFDYDGVHFTIQNTLKRFGNAPVTAPLTSKIITIKTIVTKKGDDSKIGWISRKVDLSDIIHITTAKDDNNRNITDRIKLRLRGEQEPTIVVSTLQEFQNLCRDYIPLVRIQRSYIVNFAVQDIRIDLKNKRLKSPGFQKPISFSPKTPVVKLQAFLVDCYNASIKAEIEYKD
jgi:DNA-binding LytR/AlgR family response regulator